jgi:membrane protease YdiL (CAAX protease family)
MLTAYLEPWVRVGLYLVAIGLCLEVAHRLYWVLIRWTAGLAIGVVEKSAMTAFAACLPLITACAVTYVFCIYIDNESLPAIGLRMDLHPGSYLAAGSVIAFTSVTLVFAIGYLSGWFQVRPSRISSDFSTGLPVFCGGLADFATASVFEELMMRGYVFSLLYHRVGASPAIIGSAAAFSLFHLVKHVKLPAFFSLNAFLFGLLVAQSRLATGALWMPIGLHAGWNIAAASVYGLPFAGRVSQTGLISCDVDGPELITGGYYSPDAGLLGSVALAFAAAAVLVLTPFV